MRVNFSVPSSFLLLLGLTLVPDKQLMANVYARGELGGGVWDWVISHMQLAPRREIIGLPKFYNKIRP